MNLGPETTKDLLGVGAFDPRKQRSGHLALEDASALRPVSLEPTRLGRWSPRDSVCAGGWRPASSCLRYRLGQ